LIPHYPFVELVSPVLAIEGETSVVVFVFHFLVDGLDKLKRVLDIGHLLPCNFLRVLTKFENLAFDEKVVRDREPELTLSTFIDDQDSFMA
jgi:hypothetical protein